MNAAASKKIEATFNPDTQSRLSLSLSCACWVSYRGDAIVVSPNADRRRSIDTRCKRPPNLLGACDSAFPRGSPGKSISSDDQKRGHADHRLSSSVCMQPNLNSLSNISHAETEIFFTHAKGKGNGDEQNPLSLSERDRKRS